MAKKNNRHHIFFCRKAWSVDRVTKRLRMDNYCKVVLPMDLHKELHAGITTEGGVPVMTGGDCRRVVEAIEAARRAEHISADEDNPVRRLEFLINIIGFYTDCVDTLEILQLQRDFLLSAYRKGRL